MSKKDLNEIYSQETTQEHCDCCDHDHNHDGCDCGCEDMYLPYDFEPAHNAASFANIFSIICKVIAGFYFILSTGNAVNTLFYYQETYTDLDWSFYLEFFTSTFTSVFLITIAFLAIGEVVNLLNRIKEALN